LKQKRTIYFNDTRHFFLYTLEPPLSMEDIWRPVDEAAGTCVDTFVYSVDGGGGLFYPSKVARRFGGLDDGKRGSYAWRAWKSLQDLDERGLDILEVLIQRAHARGMDFFASLRMATYYGMDSDLLVANGGKGLGEFEVRDYQFAVLRELATSYDTQGVELDLAAPGGTAWFFPQGEGEDYAPVMTEYLGEIAAMVRGRPGAPGVVGVRVYPTEEMCLRHGLDVRAWFEAGVVDWVMPMVYPYFVLDGDMPIEWLTEAAEAAGVSVYGRLQPWIRDEDTGAPQRIHADTETLRGAACNFFAKGVDGLYAHSMSWPLGDRERSMLSELGDFERMLQGDKRYVLRRRHEEVAPLGYDAPLPFEIPSADPGKCYPVPFYIADDIEKAGERIRRVTLTLGICYTVAADCFTLLLNGASLAAEVCRKKPRDPLAPYDGLELELQLERVRPRQGRNLLEISLDGRPQELEDCGVSIETIEVFIEYGSYPGGLNS
jgi:hypothetical protein